MQTFTPVTFPAGTYVVGDPCYNLSTAQYDEFLESTQYLKKVGEISSTDGAKKFPIFAFYTANGDGRFDDLSGFEFAVDSGSLAIFPAEAMEGDEIDASTKVVTFTSPFEIYDSAGVIVFGHIEINTNNGGDCDSDFGDLDNDF